MFTPERGTLPAGREPRACCLVVQIAQYGGRRGTGIPPEGLIELGNLHCRAVNDGDNLFQLSLADGLLIYL